MIRVSGQSKSRPVKAAGAEVGADRRNQKLHAAVAKNAFWSENVQNTSGPKQFLLFSCRKNARRCGEKPILKWKYTKHVSSEALFAVLPSKKCTPLWRKAHVDMKMYTTWGVWSTFRRSDVKKLHAALAKSTFGNENIQNMRCLEHFLKVWCRKIARRCGEKQIWKWKCTKHVGFGALFEVWMSKN